MELSPLKRANRPGVAGLDHVRVLIDAGASAVAAGSWFVFSGPHRAVLITYPSPDELRPLLERVHEAER